MKDQPELKIYELPVADLIPYARNAKEHGASQVDTIAASIEEFGNCDPIAVWHNADGLPEIVEGHGRLLALKKLGHEVAPVIYLDHLSDEQRRAYTHVHNQTTLNSGFDVDMLDTDIQQLDFDWASFGFGTNGFSAISDLLEEEFALNSTINHSDQFVISLVFPIEDKEVVNAYIKEVGKDTITDNIVKEARSWE